MFVKEEKDLKSIYFVTIISKYTHTRCTYTNGAYCCVRTQFILQFRFQFQFRLGKAHSKEFFKFESKIMENL